MGPHPAVAAIRVAVRRVLHDVLNHHTSQTPAPAHAAQQPVAAGPAPAGAPLPPAAADGPPLVLVACSGGADSMALASALAFEAPKLGVRAGGITVDHGLQDGSDLRAAEVVVRLRALGLDPVDAVAVEVGVAGGPEAAARDARYAALDAAAERHGAAAILLGHTRDDQAETVLLGLARGSGTRSLSGMAATTGRGGRYRRPFLEVDRQTARKACLIQSLPVWDDPHNADPLYTRSRLRHEGLPALEKALGKGVVEALARTAQLSRDDADALDSWAADAERTVLDERGALDAAKLYALPAAVRRRVLRRAAIAAGAPAARGGGRAGGSAPPPPHRRGGPADHGLARAGDRQPPRARGCATAGWQTGDPAGLSRTGPLCRTSLMTPNRARVARVDDKDMGSDLQSVLISKEEIDAKLAELAAKIDAEYAGKDLLLVGVLKGAVMVMADLARALSNPVTMDWMAVSSYGAGTQSSGVVRILKDLDTDIKGKHVLIVEDIIDSGLTLSWLLSNLGSREPASLEVCTLLRKPDAAKVAIDVKWIGFDIPNEFVVGYGLDFAEKYRNLPFVGTLAPHVYGG